MSRLKSGIGIACILFAGAFLLVFDLFFESTAYLWFLKGYIAFVNLQLLAFFLFQFFVQPCTEHICWNAKHKSRDGKHDILGVNGVFGDSGDRDRRAIGAGSVIQSFDARHGDRLDADFGHVGAPGVCQNDTNYHPQILG